jgi:hypothetical protein
VPDYYARRTGQSDAKWRYLRGVGPEPHYFPPPDPPRYHPPAAGTLTVPAVPVTARTHPGETNA